MTELDSLSFRATLMSRDLPVGEIKGRFVEPIQKELLPLYFQKGGDVQQWLSSRAIDDHRTNSRLLKKVLRLKERDDVSTALHFNAATITDSYWIRPANSILTWEDVRFKENQFDRLALQGDLSTFSKRPSRTPELTNTGSYEKCWKMENGQWWMYKQSTPLARFSELFVYELSKAFEWPAAVYERSGDNIRTPDFTQGKLNYEPAWSLVGDEEDYVTNYQTFQKLGQPLADQYVELLLMDSFCLNADRHTNNYGLLRDRESGKILSMAPNFDNNIALISDGYKQQPRKPDLFGQLLAELEESEQAVSSYAKRHSLPIVTPDLIAQCCRATGEDVDIPYVQQFVMVGYEQTPIPKILQVEHKRSVKNVCESARNEACKTNATEENSKTYRECEHEQE